MQGFGEHLQLSVFQCDLTAIDRVEMQTVLQDIIDRDEDKVLIIDLGPTDSYPVKSFQVLGKQLKPVTRGSIVA